MILVTGGCGYIGSHFMLRLLRKGQDIICLDNLSNSNDEVLLKINNLCLKKIIFVKGDVSNHNLLMNIFKKYKINTVVHFAGFKSISESINNPIKYYKNNVVETISLLNAMNEANVKKMIFSSSATVYGKNKSLPLHESLKIDFPDNPYAQSKLIIEKILHFISKKKDNLWSIGILRYFNPIGCHPSGKIGENMNNKNNNTNLIPAIIEVIIKKKEQLKIFGGDYNTHDGTCIRDYIHIEDLISGHEKALEYISNYNGYKIWNLGSGFGYSVLEIVKEFERALNQKIPFDIIHRRDGDLDSYWADISKAKRELDWNTKFTLIDMVKDILNQTETLK